ncbi:MAG: hypothetical protein IKP64_13930 [Selenomonadaceae bacterium]|nr:hypothetical protein [Selenomonadaceae bacterium]
MKNFFSEIDDVTLTFSDVRATRSGMEYLQIYFERPNSNGFDFLEATLPALTVKKSAGFDEEETARLLDYARTNAFLLWDVAREGGDKLCRKLQDCSVT